MRGSSGPCLMCAVLKRNKRVWLPQPEDEVLISGILETTDQCLMPTVCVLPTVGLEALQSARVQDGRPHPPGKLPKGPGGARWARRAHRRVLEAGLGLRAQTERRRRGG